MTPVNLYLFIYLHELLTVYCRVLSRELRREPWREDVCEGVSHEGSLTKSMFKQTF